MFFSRWLVYRERKLQELDAFDKIIQKYHKLCLKAYMFKRKLRFRVFGIDKTYISKGPTFIQPRPDNNHNTQVHTNLTVS